MHPITQFLIAANMALGVDDHLYRRRRWGLGLGLGATLSDLTQAIARFENTSTGYNNPGAIWDSSAGRIRQYSTPEAGWSALTSLTGRLVGMGLTPREFFRGKPGVYPGYAPAGHGDNNPDRYAEVVSQWLGWDPDRPIQDQIGTAGMVRIPGGGTWTGWPAAGATVATVVTVQTPTAVPTPTGPGSITTTPAPSWMSAIPMPEYPVYGPGSGQTQVSTASAAALIGGAVLALLISR